MVQFHPGLICSCSPIGRGAGLRNQQVHVRVVLWAKYGGVVLAVARCTCNAKGQVRILVPPSKMAYVNQLEELADLKSACYRFESCRKHVTLTE